MAKFSEPPEISFLQALSPAYHTVPMGTLVFRLFTATGEHLSSWDKFRYLGPTASRFDHQFIKEDGVPWLQERGIMYLALGNQAIATCLAEFFQQTRVIDICSRSLVLAAFELLEPLKLLVLTGPFATKIGASMAIHSGQRARARRWAQQLYLAFPLAQGIHYCSSMDMNAPAIALFERGGGTIPPTPVFHRCLDDMAMRHVVIDIAERIGYGLIQEK